VHGIAAHREKSLYGAIPPESAATHVLVSSGPIAADVTVAAIAGDVDGLTAEAEEIAGADGLIVAEAVAADRIADTKVDTRHSGGHN
jgi:hypothetical protein